MNINRLAEKLVPTADAASRQCAARWAKSTAYMMAAVSVWHRQGDRAP